MFFTGTPHSILCKRVTETVAVIHLIYWGGEMGILRSEHMLNDTSEIFNVT